MTEQVPPPGVDDVEPAVGDGRHPPIPTTPVEPTSTGVSAVDAVIADVEGLPALPLDEHLAAYERAHASLRSALDADPGEPA